MEAHLYEEWKEKSSLALKGRFFLILLLLFSCFQSLHGANGNPPSESNPERISDEKPEQKSPVKIYVTGGAEISFVDNAIVSPIVIIKDHSPKQILRVKQKRLKKKIKRKQEKVVQTVAKPSKIFLYENQNRSQLDTVNESLGKGIITSHQTIVFAIIRFFLLHFILFSTLYLIFYDNENILFRRILGRNFQRPPPF